MTGNTGYLRFPHILGDQIVFTAEDDIWLVDASGRPARPYSQMQNAPLAVWRPVLDTRYLPLDLDRGWRGRR